MGHLLKKKPKRIWWSFRYEHALKASKCKACLYNMKLHCHCLSKCAPSGIWRLYVALSFSPCLIICESISFFFCFVKMDRGSFLLVLKLILQWTTTVPGPGLKQKRVFLSCWAWNEGAQQWLRLSLRVCVSQDSFCSPAPAAQLRWAYTEKGTYWVHIIRKFRSMAECRG